MSEERPEWVKCIMQKAPRSFCGRHIANEFHFTSVEHATNTVVQGGRLRPCLDCVSKADDALNGPDKRLDNSALNLLLEIAKRK